MANEVQKSPGESIEKVERTRSGRTYAPATDILERSDEIILIADMPGVTEESVDITLENNQLTIQGFVETEQPEGHSLYYAEYESGDFFRAFSINETIDRDKIEANLKDGVLRLRLPKLEAAKAKKIKITTN
jgi:HSP20 family protein